jgi:hypothetical protein
MTCGSCPARLKHDILGCMLVLGKVEPGFRSMLASMCVRFNDIPLFFLLASSLSVSNETR